jgi:hypothetical protein
MNTHVPYKYIKMASDAAKMNRGQLLFNGFIPCDKTNRLNKERANVIPRRQ